MTTNPVVVVLARITAKPGKEDAVRQELMNVVRETRKEAGSVKFEAHQSTEDPRLFVVYENWTRRQDIDDHIATPHVQRFLGRSEDLFGAPLEVTFWERREPEEV